MTSRGRSWVRASSSRTSCAVDGVLRGAGALGDRELQLHEQHVAELLGRVDVEALAGDPVDPLGTLVELGFEPGRLAGQHAGVDPDAGPLEGDQHRDQRAFERVVDRRQLGGLHLLGDDRRDLRRQVCALAGPRQQRLRRDRARRDRLDALADDRFEGAGAIGQQLERDRVELGLGPVGVEQVAGELGVEIDAGQRDAVLGQHHRRLFQGVAVLLDRRVFEQRLQRRRHRRPGRAGRHLLGRLVEQASLRRGRARRGVGGAVRVGERHVARLAGLGGEAEADEGRAHRRVAVRHHVEREPAGRAALGDERCRPDPAATTA